MKNPRSCGITALLSSLTKSRLYFFPYFCCPRKERAALGEGARFCFASWIVSRPVNHVLVAKSLLLIRDVKLFRPCRLDEWQEDGLWVRLGLQTGPGSQCGANLEWALPASWVLYWPCVALACPSPVSWHAECREKPVCTACGVWVHTKTDGQHHRPNDRILWVGSGQWACL